MKYYIHPTTKQLHAYELDGSQDHLIPADFEAASDAEVQVVINPKIDSTTLIKQQIFELELSITPRRLRDAIISKVGKQWLIDIEDRIAALRTTLI